LKITPTLWLRKLCPIATQPADHSIINLQSSLLFIRMLFDYVFYGGWMPNLRKTSDLAAQRRGVGSGANDPKSFIRAPVGGFRHFGAIDLPAGLCLKRFQPIRGIRVHTSRHRLGS
jgi:hypothetical protein